MLRRQYYLKTGALKGSICPAAGNRCLMTRDVFDSRQNVSYDVAFDVGQAKIAAGVAVREALVVEAEEVQNRGVQVVDVDLVLGGVIAVVVGAAVAQAALHP